MLKLKPLHLAALQEQHLEFPQDKAHDIQAVMCPHAHKHALIVKDQLQHHLLSTCVPPAIIL